MPVSLSVDARACERAAVRMREAAALLTHDVDALVPALAQTARVELAAATPHAPGSGGSQGQHAADLWEVRASGPHGAEVWNTAHTSASTPYVQFLFTGTAPHLIEPKDAAMLHFFAGGDEVFAHAVQHPGTQRSEPLVDTLAAQARHADEALSALGVKAAVTLGKAVGG